MNTQETQEAAPDRRQGKPNIYEAMLKLKREHEILSERYESALSGRDYWRRQAEEKWAMRRELEDLLGVDHAAASDEQFKKGVDRLKEIIQERDEMSESNQVLLAEVKHYREKTERVSESSQENNLKLALEQVAILAKALKVERDEARECAVRYRSLYYTQLGIEGSASFFPWEESK